MIEIHKSLFEYLRITCQQADKLRDELRQICGDTDLERHATTLCTTLAAACQVMVDVYSETTALNLTTRAGSRAPGHGPRSARNE